MIAIWRRRWAWLVAALFAYVALSPSTACNKYAGVSAAYRMTIMVDRLAREAAPHVAAWVSRAAADCKAKHGSKTTAYQTCFKPTADKGRALIVAIRMNESAQDTTRAVHLGIAKADVMRVAAAAGCAILSAANAIGAFVPSVAKVAVKLQSIKGVACGLAR